VTWPDRLVLYENVPLLRYRETIPEWFFRAGGKLVTAEPNPRPYTDSELDRLVPCLSHIETELAKVGRRLACR